MTATGAVGLEVRSRTHFFPSWLFIISLFLLTTVHEILYLLMLCHRYINLSLLFTSITMYCFCGIFILSSYYLHTILILSSYYRYRRRPFLLSQSACCWVRQSSVTCQSGTTTPYRHLPLHHTELCCSVLIRPTVLYVYHTELYHTARLCYSILYHVCSMLYMMIVPSSPYISPRIYSIYSF